MPNVIDNFPKFKERLLNARGWYVYAWANVDWGGVYFYIGKGHNGRAMTPHGRGASFTAILNQWECFPVLLKDGLTEEQACAEEDRLKSVYIFEQGCPIMDGEGNSVVLKNMAQRRGIAAMPVVNGKRISLKTGRPMGNPGKDLPDFEKFFKKVKKGEISVSESCRQLGISRTQWYRLCKDETMA